MSFGGIGFGRELERGGSERRVGVLDVNPVPEDYEHKEPFSLLSLKSKNRKGFFG